MFGAGAWNCRLTRSNGQAAALSGVVVLTTLPRTTPSSPRHAISGRRLAADLEAFAVELQPDLLRTVDVEVPGVDTDDLLRQRLVLLRPCGAKVGIGLAANVLVPGGGGDPQNPAHRLDPAALHMGLHEGGRFRSGRSSSAWAK